MSALSPALRLHSLSPPPPPPPRRPSPDPFSSLRRSLLPRPNPFRPPTIKPQFSTRNPRSRRLVPLAINLITGNPDPSHPSEKLFDAGGLLDHARNLFDNLPHPVKIFPWAKVLESFSQILLDLAFAVAKYLSIPVLAVSSLSEMSYCAHERKMGVIPVPFLVGFAVAGALQETALEISSELKGEGFPWHLMMIGSLFLMLKLPGPYYPYWGRLLIPHFANGGLWRTAWLAFSWYRRPQNVLK